MNATDLDTGGANAELRYYIQSGSFEDFVIDNLTGVMTVNKRLDYDKRSNYKIEVVVMDQGVPSLSGSTFLNLKINDINNKEPYFSPVTQKVEVIEH